MLLRRHRSPRTIAAKTGSEVALAIAAEGTVATAAVPAIIVRRVIAFISAIADTSLCWRWLGPARVIRALASGRFSRLMPEAREHGQLYGPRTHLPKNIN
jgi:hypothetical protein